MDGEAGWWTTSGNIGLPPLARAMGVGRQQQFEEEVDDVVPPAVREVSLEPGGWVKNYIKEEIRKVQLEDDIAGKVLIWLELGGEPLREQLLLADTAVICLEVQGEFVYLRWGN